MREKTEQQDKVVEFTQKNLDQVTPPAIVPKVVLNAIHDVRLWVRNLTDDWSTVKREIISELHYLDRACFSSKDPVTKKEVPPNEMERAIIDYWEELTGVRLVVRSLEERKKLGIRLR